MKTIDACKSAFDAAPVITYATAMAAGQDAGNRNAAKNGRTVWTQADWDVAARVSSELMTKG
jgi:hypothetical protein